MDKSQGCYRAVARTQAQRIKSALIEIRFWPKFQLSPVVGSSTTNQTPETVKTQSPEPSPSNPVRFASPEKAAQLLPWSLGKPSLGDPPRQKEDICGSLLVSSFVGISHKLTVAEGFDHLGWFRSLQGSSAKSEALGGLAHVANPSCQTYL